MSCMHVENREGIYVVHACRKQRGATSYKHAENREGICRARTHEENRPGEGRRALTYLLILTKVHTTQIFYVLFNDGSRYSSSGSNYHPELASPAWGAVLNTSIQ